MNLETLEWHLRRIGGGTVLATLGSILWGLERGRHRPRGGTTGLADTVLRGPAYLGIGAGYFGLCSKLWRPIPQEIERIRGHERDCRSGSS